MSYPPLPAPAFQSAPNVPADLGNVATALETQVLAQYNVYNSSNNPSATSLETRVTAIDGPSGTAAGLDTQVSNLSTAINTWTNGSASNLATQTARTTAFGPRQDGHDTTMGTLAGSLGTYEPSLTNLQTQRPGGLVLHREWNPVNIPVTATAVGPIGEVSFNGTAQSQRVYRVCYQGTVTINSPTTTPPWNLAIYFGATGSNPHQIGCICGPNFGYKIPFTVVGYTSGLNTGSWTTSLYAIGFVAGGGYSVTDFLAMSVEDLGYRYY